MRLFFGPIYALPRRVLFRLHLSIVKDIRIMKIKVIAASVGLVFLGSSSVSANIIMTGDFISTQVSNDGTLGEGSSAPGLLYDETGTGSFDPDTDYIKPGNPFEGFGVQYTQGGSTFVGGNRNSISAGGVGGSDNFSLTSLTDLSSSSIFDNYVSWVGTNGVVDIVHDFFFDNDDELINITTTITALTDLTGLLFSRAVDPDPDSSLAGGSPQTENQRGIDANNDGDFDDVGDIALENFVGSVGQLSNKPLGLFADSSFTQNTGIATACCSTIDPMVYLLGGQQGDSSLADHGIGIGFELGDLSTGSSVSVDYAYVMGGTLETIGIPDDPTVNVSAPTTFGLLGLSLLAMFRRFSVKHD